MLRKPVPPAGKLRLRALVSERGVGFNGEARKLILRHNIESSAVVGRPLQQGWTMRLVAVVAVVLAFAEPGQAQTVSRTPWGDPDLQGLWSNASVTPLERPAILANKPFWTEAEAANVEKSGLETLLKAVASEVPLSGELNGIWLEVGKVVRNRST